MNKNHAILPSEHGKQSESHLCRFDLKGIPYLRKYVKLDSRLVSESMLQEGSFIEMNHPRYLTEDNLIISKDGPDGSIDSETIDKIIEEKLGIELTRKS